MPDDPNRPTEPRDGSREADPSDFRAQPDPHVDPSAGSGQAPRGVRVPTPDPKDQTGDPAEEPNPAMRELRKRRTWPGRPSKPTRI
jgi:hypothetical protein